MEAWRIVPASRAAGAFDGEGARLYGGRWNSRGRRAVYAAGSRALAALEVLVHLSPAATRREFALLRVHIPGNLVWRAEATGTLPDFRAAAVSPHTQRFGDAWLAEAAGPALEVPSSVIPEEYNLLLNPAHPDFAKFRIDPPLPFAFDPRLLPSTQR